MSLLKMSPQSEFQTCKVSLAEATLAAELDVADADETAVLETVVAALVDAAWADDVALADAWAEVDGAADATVGAGAAAALDAAVVLLVVAGAPAPQAASSAEPARPKPLQAASVCSACRLLFG